MHFTKIASKVCRLFWAIFLPALLVTQVMMSIWLIGVELPLSMTKAKTFKRPLYHNAKSDYTAAAIAIVVVLAISLALWIAPVAYCLWSSWFIAKYRFTLTDAQDCIQVQDNSGHARYCEICNIFQQDRMYHDGSTGKCLPQLDHHCEWWSGTVWRDNKKPYLFFLTTLPVHLLYCLCIAIWTLKVPQFKESNPYIGFFLVDGFFIIVALLCAITFWLRIAFYNVSSMEYAQGTIWYRLPVGTIVAWEIKAHNHAESPWYLGWRENFRLTMGRKRDLLFFWKATPMATADPLPTRDMTSSSSPPQDIEMQDFGSSSRSRRSAIQSSSTGYQAELSTWEFSLRRRRATDDT